MNESKKNDLDDLYAEFGRTAEMAQVMELEAGNLALSYVMIAFDVNNLKLVPGRTKASAWNDMVIVKTSAYFPA